MIKNAEVQISDQMYEASKESLKYFRALALCPLTVYRKKSQLYLKFSLGYIIYSYVFGLILCVLYGIYEELCRGAENSMKVKSDTDRAVALLAHAGYFVVTANGIFIMPTKVARFFEYIEILNEVDLTIGILYSKRDKYASLLTITALLSVSIIFGFLDFYTLYRTATTDNAAFKLLSRYGFIDILVLLTITIEYTNRHLAHGLEIRLKRINEVLQQTYQDISKHRINQNSICCSKLNDVRKSYMKLIGAAEILNDILGLSALVIIVSVLFLFIVSGFNFIIAVQGRRSRTVALLPKVYLLCMHIMRVLMITEPWYACSQKIETIKSLVCKLLTLKLSRPYRKQVDCFAWSMCLHEFRFSACGFFDIDRAMFTSMLGTVTTYVVILLQSDVS